MTPTVAVTGGPIEPIKGGQQHRYQSNWEVGPCDRAGKISFKVYFED